MVAPTLTMEQYQYDDTGVLLNGATALPFFDVESVDGFDNAPFRTSAHDREGMDGGTVDAQFESTRTITIEGTAYADPTNLETYLDSLKANYAPTATVKPLYLRVDGASNQDRLVYAKSLGIRFAKTTDRRLGIVPAQIQLQAEDPRIYAVTAVAQNLPGTLALVGNRDSTGTIVINGARTNPTITLGSSVLTFTLTIAGGSSVTIDLWKRTIIRSDGTNVRSAVAISGGWPKLVPGNNVFTIGGTGAGTITATARSAWR